MSGRKPNKPLATSKLRSLYEVIESFTYEERIKILGLNPDRADVIIPASKILLSVLKNAEIEKIPYCLVVGEREAKVNAVAVRKKGEGNIGTFNIDEFIGTIKEEAQEGA